MTKQSSYYDKLRTGLRYIGARIVGCWRAKWWHKVLMSLLPLGLLGLGAMYGIARWYIASEQSKPLVYGTSFIAPYAESLGLNAQDTMQALIDDMGVRHFRLVSYWNQHEQSPGQYDFSSLDWQFKKAEQAGAKVTLSIGLRQPRWPECHMPAWAASETPAQWQPQLERYMTEVVKRYQNSPSLESYQLENEFFLKGFGTCTNFDRNRLVSEYKLVKQLDTKHPVIVSRSNNALGMPVGDPKPDLFGISIYKRVWDATLTHRYVEYPFPAWYYAFLAGTQKIFTGRDMVIHELQAEAWPPHGQSMQDTSLEEQNKSIDAERLHGRFEHGRATGMHTIYLWGGEYWYYRKQILHDPSLWDVAKQEFQQTN